MSATAASIGFGCILQRDAGGSPSSYSDIGEVIDPGAMNMTRDTIDATHTQSTNRYREFLGGLRDAGEFTTTLALIPGGASLAQLVSDFENNSPVGYRFNFNNSGAHRWYFNAFVTSVAQTMPMDDRMTVACTFKITGQPALSSNG